jgi:hypothetical protein
MTLEPSDFYGTVVTVERGILDATVTDHRDAVELTAASGACDGRSSGEPGCRC